MNRIAPMTPIKAHIAIRLHVRTPGVFPVFFPRKNRVATNLLTALLKARLELAGVQCHRATGLREFNRALIWIEVDAAARALPLIKSEMDAQSFDQCCEIAMFDPGEGVWRTYWQALAMPASDFKTLFSPETLRKEAAWGERWLRVLMPIGKLLGKLWPVFCPEWTRPEPKSTSPRPPQSPL